MKRIPKVLTGTLLSAALALQAAALGSAGVVRVSSGRLNVRAAATTSAAIRASVTNGTYLTLLCAHGDWWFVEYADGRYGYVHGDYVEKLPALPTAPVLAPITLDVPSYKQYAAEYASLCLPGSGESVRTHGCAVTALAMTESYRTGTAVTPAEILETERFTETGAIYWHEGYTGGEGSGAAIYRALAAGKPVIVHGKKADGTTHFAVVYGYTGGTLAPESFLLHDPGSAHRTTLADFLAVYPTLVKTVSY